MKEIKNKVSIGAKIYAFVGTSIIIASTLIAILSFAINGRRINQYAEQLSLDTAKNFSGMIDPDFLTSLRDILESEEYQALIDKTMLKVAELQKKYPNFAL